MSNPEGRKYSKAQHVYLITLAMKQVAWRAWQAAGDDDRVNEEYTRAIDAVHQTENELIDWAKNRLPSDAPILEALNRGRALHGAFGHRGSMLDYCMRLDPGDDGKTLAEWVLSPIDWSAGDE